MSSEDAPWLAFDIVLKTTSAHFESWLRSEHRDMPRGFDERIVRVSLGETLFLTPILAFMDGDGLVRRYFRIWVFLPRKVFSSMEQEAQHDWRHPPFDSVFPFVYPGNRIELGALVSFLFTIKDSKYYGARPNRDDTIKMLSEPIFAVVLTFQEITDNRVHLKCTASGNHSPIMEVAERLYSRSIRVFEVAAIVGGRFVEEEARQGRGARTPAEPHRPPGRPGLPRCELVERLAYALWAEEMKEADHSKTWKEIAWDIGWRWGGPGKARVKLLEDARSRLRRVRDNDPEGLLAEATELSSNLRRAKETKGSP